MKKPFIQDRNTEILLGLAALITGACLLRDAFEGRGREQPKLLRPFSFW